MYNFPMFGASMKFRKLALLVAITCAVPSGAQESPRFAFFIPQYIAENTAQGKRVFAEVETLGKKLEDAMKVKAEELQKLEQQLRSSSISEEGRSRLAREFEDGRTAYQRMGEDSQGQMQRALTAANRQFQSEIDSIIAAVAVENNLHCVFQAQEGTLAWVDQKWFLNYTEEVAKRYDAAFPGGVAAKPAAKPASPATK
jgi:Skp family chaperone for outer membrane proteins